MMPTRLRLNYRRCWKPPIDPPVAAGQLPGFDTSHPYSFPCSRGKECRPHEEADEALGRLGIDELAERPFLELSGGERQLVVLAQALVQRSPLLLLDEPAASLDVSHQLRLLRNLRLVRARRAGRMVYYSLDDQHIVTLFQQGLRHVAEAESGGGGAAGR